MNQGRGRDPALNERPSNRGAAQAKANDSPEMTLLREIRDLLTKLTERLNPPAETLTISDGTEAPNVADAGPK